MYVNHVFFLSTYDLLTSLFSSHQTTTNFLIFYFYYIDPLRRDEDENGNKNIFMTFKLIFWKFNTSEKHFFSEFKFIYKHLKSDWEHVFFIIIAHSLYMIVDHENVCHSHPHLNQLTTHNWPLNVCFSGNSITVHWKDCVKK
jgi:hypothetical protein